MTETWIKRLMAATDIGFVLYWTATATALIPTMGQRILDHWNWSFLALDLVAAGTGLLSLRLLHRDQNTARALILVSLALTHAAGLTALNFWVLRQDFAPQWWLPNLWLTVFPIVAITILLRRWNHQTVKPPQPAAMKPGSDQTPA